MRRLTGRRLTGSLGLALALTIGTMGTALAWPDDFQGRPEQFEVGGDAGYYIWHDDGGVHLATTGPGPKREFHAVVHTDGEFEDIDQVRLEEGDRYALRDGGKTLAIDFTTFGRSDTIRWRVKDGTEMTFRLTVDGHPIAPRNIYLGADGHHPPRPVFEIPR